MQDAYIYAIRQDTYELLYMNQKLLRLDPSARPAWPVIRHFTDAAPL